MKQYFRNYCIRWAIWLALFNIVTFVTPDEWNGMYKYGGGFWAGYIFITLAFLGHLLVTYMALRVDSAEKMFMNMPLIRISNIGAVLTFILGVISMTVLGVKNWMGVVACCLVLGFTAMACLRASSAADAVTTVGSNVDARTSFIRSLRTELDAISVEGTDKDLQSEYLKLKELVRYSDPVSSGAATDIEAKIEDKAKEFATVISDEDKDKAHVLLKEIMQLVNERNTKIKSSK